MRWSGRQARGWRKGREVMMYVHTVHMHETLKFEIPFRSVRIKGTTLTGIEQLAIPLTARETK